MSLKRTSTPPMISIVSIVEIESLVTEKEREKKDEYLEHIATQSVGFRTQIFLLLFSFSFTHSNRSGKYSAITLMENVEC